jgi:membrane peptidoglycan carboxypeptidase
METDRLRLHPLIRFSFRLQIYNHLMRNLLKSKLVRFLFFIFLLFAAFFIYLFYDLPSIRSIPENLNRPSVKITDRSGRLLYEIIPTEGGRNAVLSAEKLPQCIKDATIAVEDKNFYQNPGVDVWGLVRVDQPTGRRDSFRRQYHHPASGADLALER